ncbi:GntR family transcriptional regulator [soil metagenome]
MSRGAQGGFTFGGSEFAVVRESHQPLWSQVKASIQAMIAAAGLGEHARLPTEQELCEQFRVSRTVVREALNQLVFERRIYKIQGKGAFVAGPREDQDFFGSTVSFSGELHEKHRVVTRRILLQRLAAPEERIQRMLRMSRDEQAVELDRVLSVDGVPRIRVRTFLRAARVPGLEQIPLHNRSLYDTLSRQYGIVLTEADRWVEAIVAEGSDAEHLGVPDGTPLLAIESCSYAGGEPVEHYAAHYRTDQARLHFKVK